MAKISRLGNCHPDFFPGAHPALPVPAPLMLGTMWALSCYKSYQMLAFFYQHLFQNRKGIGNRHFGTDKIWETACIQF